MKKLSLTLFLLFSLTGCYFENWKVTGTNPTSCRVYFWGDPGGSYKVVVSEYEYIVNTPPVPNEYQFVATVFDANATTRTEPNISTTYKPQGAQLFGVDVPVRSGFHYSLSISDAVNTTLVYGDAAWSETDQIKMLIQYGTDRFSVNNWVP